jgi:hypothetical protein
MRKVIAVILASILALSSVGILVGCSASGKIDKVSISEQESGGVKFKNYAVYLKADVDWAGISDSERQQIAVAGYDEAQKQVKTDGVFNYNITGYLNDQAVFMYDKENSRLVLLVDNKAAGTVDVPKPE